MEVQAWAIGVEEARHLDAQPVLAAIVEASIRGAGQAFVKFQAPGAEARCSMFHFPEHDLTQQFINAGLIIPALRLQPSRIEM